MATDTPAHVAGFGPGDPGGEVDPVPYLDRKGDAPNGFIIGKERLEPGQRLLWLDGTARQPACEVALFEFDAYCQVVCRTWQPRVTEEGVPALLNYLDSELTPTMISVVRAALRLAPPELTFPPQTESRPPDYGTSPVDPSYWLRQLGSPAQRRHRS